MLSLLQVASQVADLTADPCRKAIIGAVAVRKDGVMVASRNGSAKDKCPSIHAEIRALRKSGFGATVYVSRIKRDGSLAMAKPCPYCMAALRARGVEMVYYTVSNTEWEARKP
jgi:tRNA(Arg) A34 adenosine deaminase TadA